MTKFPPITKFPKALITSPAASIPSCPWDNINLVEARLSDNRSIVDTNKTVGKELKSRGFSINNVVIKIKTDTMIESAKATSINHFGIGKIKTTIIPTNPSAKKISLLLLSSLNVTGKGRAAFFVCDIN